MITIPAHQNLAGKRVTKATIKAQLQASIERAHHDCSDRIESMKEQAHNPQVALMIEKNKGYLMALEDVTELLYGHRIF